MGSPIGDFVKRLVELPSRGAKISLDYLNYIVRDKNRPFGPEEAQTISERASHAHTPDEARDILDTLLGGLTSSERRNLTFLKESGYLKRKLIDTKNALNPTFEPFGEGNASIAVGGGANTRTISPYTPLDRMLEETFGGDERNIALYLRETDPLAAMPFIVEQDMVRNQGSSGGSLWGGIKDRVGRVLGGTKDFLGAMITMPERIELAIGYAAYNEVGDEYVRMQMAKRFWDHRLNFWDWDRTHEKDALDVTRGIAAAGLTGEAAAEELQKHFDRDKLGAAGFFADFLGKAVNDPFWLIPGAALLTKPGKVGLKALTGTDEFAKLLRVIPLSPGRSLLPKYGTKAILNMDARSYELNKIITPAKGVARLLVERRPDRFADEALRQLDARLAPFSQELFDLKNPNMLLDVEATFATGKPVGWMAEKMPDILADDTMARFSAIVDGKKWLKKGYENALKSDLFSQLAGVSVEKVAEQAKVLGLTAEEVIPFYQSFLVRHAIADSTRTAVMEFQEALFKSHPLGKFWLNRVHPFNQGVRKSVAAMTINTPGFVWLNVAGNYVRFMWSAARHPIRATEIFTKSMSTEIGGQWPKAWQQLVKNPLIRVNPLDVELNVVKNTGFHDILGARTAENLADLGPDELIELVSKQIAKPARDIMEKNPSKFFGIPTDVLMAPVYLAGKVDKATRRSTYVMSLYEQIGLGLKPGWVAGRGIIPDVTTPLVDAGMDVKQARRVQGSLVDKMKRMMLGELEFDPKETEVDVVRRLVGEVIDEFDLGEATTVWSGSEAAYRFVKDARGLADDASRFAVVSQFDNAVIPRINGVMKNVKPTDDVDTVMRKLDHIVEDFEGLNETAAQLSGLPPFPVPNNNYTRNMGLTEMAMKADMMDHLMHHTRHGRQIWKTGWTRTKIEVPDGRIMTPSQYFNESARNFAPRRYERLAAIRGLHRTGQGEGLRVARPGLAPIRPIEADRFNLDVAAALKTEGQSGPSAMLDVVQRYAREGKQLDKGAFQAIVKAERELITHQLKTGTKFENAMAIRDFSRTARQASIHHSPVRPEWMPRRERVKLTHFSKQEREVLDAGAMGTGAGGARVGAQEGQRRPQTLFLYKSGAKPEKQVVGAGFTVKHEVEADMAIGDIFGFAEDYAKLHPDLAKNLTIDDVEWLMVNEGFDGYVNSQAKGALKGVVNTFYDVVPRKVTIEDDILQATLKDKGGTFGLGGEVPSTGYAVGAFPERAITLAADKELTKTALKNFVDENVDLLSRRGYYVGTWVDDDGVKHLDVAQVLGNKDDAIRLGATRGRQAIYGFKEGKTFGVPAALRDELSAEDQGRMWAEYFRLGRAGTDDLADRQIFLTKKASKNPEHVARIEAWRTDQHATSDAHEAALRKAMREGTDEAYKEAAEDVKVIYESSANRRAGRQGVFPWKKNDPATALKQLDTTGPHSAEIREFVEFFKKEIREEWPDFAAGKSALAKPASAKEVMRTMGEQISKDWPKFRQQVTGQAMAKTDFVMLNYNNQYGFDMGLQTFAPFAFWPTRDAVHWSMRMARAPGAFGTIVQFMLSTKEYQKQYNLPERLAYEIPIYLPGMDQVFGKVPLLNEMLGDTEMGPWYFIDPMRFVFPYRDFVNNFDDEKKRGTPMGLALDYFEQYTPVSANPFMKLIGRETGMLDKDAWGAVYFGGGPFGIPTTATAQAAAKWLYTGDERGVPNDEAELYTDEGHFSSNFLMRILGVEDDRWDDYRTERAVWTLAATDKLLPGKPHDEQIRAGWEAIDTHKGRAWKNALKASGQEEFLRNMTFWAGFPFGGVQGVQEGELMWFGLKQAFNEAAERGELGEFYDRYPEFQLRRAVVKGLTSPEEKAQAVDTELYYEDVDRYVNAPFQQQLDEMDGKLLELKNMDQTEVVRESIKVIRTQLNTIREEQDRRRELLEVTYPNREKELSVNRTPRERALTVARNGFYDIEFQEGEDYEAYLLRQTEYLEQFEDGEGFSEEEWHDLFVEFMQMKLRYGRAIDSAARKDDYDRITILTEERDAMLEELHERATLGLSAEYVNDYILQTRRPKTAEENEFELASDMFDTWMSLVGSGSLLSGREKASISEYFRSLPEIQKHYRSSTIELDQMTPEQKAALMRRREIWRRFYQFYDPEMQLDYIYSVEDELRFINDMLGLGNLQIVDYRRPPVELPAGDPLYSRMQMRMAELRRQQLSQEQTEITAEDMSELEALMAGSNEDPSSMVPEDLDFYMRPYQ